MEILISFAGALFLVGLTAYVALLAMRELTVMQLVRGTAAIERNLLGKQIAELAERRRREQEKAERTWDGFRKFVVARKTVEAADISSFYLEPHDRRPLPTFQPGQYLTFRLNIPGQPKQVIRCYSLSDAPKPSDYRVTIKRIGPAPGKADSRAGLVSSHFHDQIEEGDIVDVKAPSGQFFLEPSEHTPVVLIAGGIGLTPLLSMLNTIVDLHSQRDVWLFYGVRHRDEHIMADHLRALAEEHANIHLRVCYSDPRPDIDSPGKHYDHGERVSLDLLKRELPSNAGDFFVCGPPPMMQAMAEGLLAWGVDESRIHHEAFGPASVKRTGVAVPAPATAIEIAFSVSGKRCEWDGQSTLLEIAEAQGIHIDSGCRAGNCGTCITAVKSGTVDYSTKPGFAVESGSCLACVALPTSSIVVVG